MFIDLLRNNRVVAILLAILRVYIGYRWVTAGFSKIQGGSFEAGGFIQMASENAAVPGWWAGFLQTVALPNQEFFSFLVMWGELLVGIALILGVFTNFAALMGITMNLSFLFSGAGMIDAQMAILTVFIAIAGNNAGRYGLDRWVIPFLKTKTFNGRLAAEH
jgi:thiosulfate dehydrogenase [quinone] large subunit